MVEQIEKYSSTIAEIKIGLESTGHYSDNIKLFLISKGFSVLTFKSLTTKSFVHSQSLRKTKTDKSEAKAIAQKLMTETHRQIEEKE